MRKKIARMATWALFAGSLGLTALPPPAHAQTGFLCGFTSITDPTVEGDVQIGEVDGGPLFAADVDNPGEETANIAIRCTIQVGAQGAVHSGVDAADVLSESTPAVTVLPPTAISYVSPPGTPVYLCTTAIVNGQVRYFNETEDNATRGWSTSSASLCALAISQEISVPECSDGVDNDLDGAIDFPNDPQCTSPDDDSELT